MGDFVWSPFVRRSNLLVGLRHHPLAPLLLEKGVNLLLRLTQLLILLRSPPVPSTSFEPLSLYALRQAIGLTSPLSIEVFAPAIVVVISAPAVASASIPSLLHQCVQVVKLKWKSKCRIHMDFVCT